MHDFPSGNVFVYLTHNVGTNVNFDSLSCILCFLSELNAQCLDDPSFFFFSRNLSRPHDVTGSLAVHVMLGLSKWSPWQTCRVAVEFSLVRERVGVSSIAFHCILFVHLTVWGCLRISIFLVAAHTTSFCYEDIGAEAYHSMQGWNVSMALRGFRFPRLTILRSLISNRFCVIAKTNQFCRVDIAAKSCYLAQSWCELSLLPSP